MTIAWLTLAGHAMADEFTIADLTINPGMTKNISLELINTDNSYIAFEFYMVLPEGVTIPVDEDGYLMAELNDARINRHVLEVERMNDGSYHFMCYSNRNTSLEGTSGEIILLTVKAADDATPGVKEGKLLNQKLSDLNKNKVTFDDYIFHVTISGTEGQEGLCPHGCQLGDVNKDGRLTVADVMMLIKMLLLQ